MSAEERKSHCAKLYCVHRTCRVISHLYRKKLNVAERGFKGPSVGGLGNKTRPPPRSRGGAPCRGFLYRSSRYKKVQFYCHSAGGERALFPPISDKFNFFFKFHSVTFYYLVDYVSMVIFNFSSQRQKWWAHLKNVDSAVDESKNEPFV